MAIISPFFRRMADIFCSNTTLFGMGFQTSHFNDGVIDITKMSLQVAPLTAIEVQSDKGYIVK